MEMNNDAVSVKNTVFVLISSLALACLAAPAVASDVGGLCSGSLGLTTGQLNILVVVAKLGPLPPGAVARKLNMEKSTVSRNIERMQKHGWLAVSSDDSGRKQTLTLAAKGRRLLERSLPAWKKAQLRTTALLGQRGAKSILRVGDAVWAHLARA